MRRVMVGLTLMVVVLFAAVSLSAQGRSTINGTVYDKSGGTVPKAKVELTDKATGAVLTTTSGDNGYFVFTSVNPGAYKVTVSLTGFRQAVIDNVSAEVGKAATVNVTLEVGQVSEVVEVVAGTGIQLQTLDASVGDVMNQDALMKLPSLSRDATAILLLQPMTAPGNNGAPGSGEGDFTGGQVAGSRSDQNTFILDGGDATSNTEASGGYAQQAGSGFAATPRASVPTPIESIEEFRVTTNNSNSFSRSAGGEVQMVTRRGTNDWHGAVYENLQNTNFNANLWQLNRTGQPRPIWIDNRFGGRVGGPIIKDKAFFFLMYEGRRFKRGVPDSRLVPSALLKQGILQFRDSTGAVRQYDLATSTACGPAGGQACDPRAATLGFSLNPIISQIWAFEPDGNNVNSGDGLNTIGFDYSVPSIVNENLGVARLDYKLSQKWDFSSSYRYFVNDPLGTGQNDIGGLLPGHTKGVPAATRSVPTAPRYLTLGLLGRLSNTLTNDFHFNWLRHWWSWTPVSPFPQVSGTAAAVQIFSETRGSGLVPLNIDTQNARARSWNGHDYAWTDNLSWVKGNHLLQFGGEVRREHFTHVRDDKVVGGLTSPVYFALFSSSDQNISGAGFAPPLCGGGVTTNCLNGSADLSRWNSLYASVTGYLRRGTQLLTRQSDFSPNPPGTPLLQDSIVMWYDLRFSDTWKIKPSFTLTYGLGWGAQTPPFETTGRQTIMTDFATGQELNFEQYQAGVILNAAQGRAFVPELAYVPIRSTSRKYPYNPEWNDVDPRVSVAWNPSFREGGWLNRIFGDRKMVIRAGYGRYHDRLNGVGIVMIPALGVGFGNGVVCRRALATGGGACGTSRTTPANGFRIGVDGSTLNLPSLGSISGGVLVPGFTANANSPYEIFDWRIDPNRRVGVEDTWTLSIQREMPLKMLLEVGYVGRTAHHLYSAGDLNQVPYMWKAGGQTFADAYDAILRQIDAGTCTVSASGLATGCTAQPWYETMLAGNCAGFANCTQAMLSDPSLGGLGEFSNVLDRITGSHWFDLSSIFGPTTAFDTQIDAFQVSTSIGNSNYHAGYISLRKQTTHGLMFQANYTWSRSMDTIGVTQANTFITQSDNFRKERDYGPSAFDRRHTFNGFFVYDLPFGGSHRFSTHNWLDRVIGGWSVSGAFTASSGLPGDAWNGASCEEFGNGDASGFCSALIPLNGTLKAKAHYNADGTVNAFADPAAAASSFRKTYFSDLRLGTGAIRGFNRWNMDAAVSKDIRVTERVKVGFAVQAVNVFNHMEFQDIALRGGFIAGSDFSTPSQFGALTTQYSSPRFLNLALRVDF